MLPLSEASCPASSPSGPLLSLLRCFTDGSHSPNPPAHRERLQECLGWQGPVHRPLCHRVYQSPLLGPCLGHKSPHSDPVKGGCLHSGRKPGVLQGADTRLSSRGGLVPKECKSENQLLSFWARVTCASRRGTCLPFFWPCPAHDVPSPEPVLEGFRGNSGQGGSIRAGELGKSFTAPAGLRGDLIPLL